MTYNFTTLTTALDTKAQAIAADSSTTAKDLIYLAKAIEAINATGALQAGNNLSDLTNAAAAVTNLGLPTIDTTGITNDQVLVWNATLSKFVAGSAGGGTTVSSSDPAGTETDVSAGDFFVNTTSGEIFVAITASPNPQWAGTLGNSVNIPQGQEIFYGSPPTSGQPSSYTDATFTVPAGVEKMSVVLVGGGGGGSYSWANSAGSGGGLAYKNDIAVTAGDTYTFRVGYGGWNTSHGTDTELRDSSGTVLFKATGGKYNGTTPSNTYDQGYSKPVAGTITPDNLQSGKGGLCSSNGYGGGGGAGGYTGNGGNGSYGSTLNSNSGAGSGSPHGSGGAGGGGGGYGSSTYGFAGGGGVGLFGRGESGLGKPGENGNSFYSDGRYSGGGGSGGEDGTDNNNGSSQIRGTFGSTANSDANMNTDTGSGAGSGSRTTYHGDGGLFGGGGAGGGTSVSGNAYFCKGGMGGARVIWGYGRAFPATRTGNVS